MIRQKIVTQCSLIRLPGFPDNTVINYVFGPHVLSQNSDFFSPSPPPLPRLYFPPSPQKLSLRSYYCNPGLIKSPDRTGGVWCGSHIMLSAHLPAQLLAVVVFSLITSCQYANKLPRLFSILGLRLQNLWQKWWFFPPLLPTHLFMISWTCYVCSFTVFFLKLLSLSHVLTALRVPQLQSSWSGLAMGVGKIHFFLFVCFCKRYLVFNVEVEKGGETLSYFVSMWNSEKTTLLHSSTGFRKLLNGFMFSNV